jgi:hypothetical protein
MMNDPSFQLYQRAVALNQIAEAAQNAFVDRRHERAGNGPVATRLQERMRAGLIAGTITECGHPSQPSVWLPAAPGLLRCNDCYADAWLEARFICGGCEKAITTGGAFVGLIDAQVMRDAVIIGPWLVVYCLCVDCQREDIGAPASSPG